MSYLHWARTHKQYRFELTNSGCPALSGDEFSATAQPLWLQPRGSYSDPEFAAAVASRYGVNPDRIIQVPGASAAIFLSLAAVAEETRTVLIERPVYDPALNAARLLGLSVLALNRQKERRFDVCLDELREGLDRGAGAVFLSNLHNPSGRLISRDRMAAIVDLCSRFNAVVLVDEVYLDAAHLNRGLERWTAAGLGDNVVAFNSMTKVHGLSGLRAGWIIASEERAQRLRMATNATGMMNPVPTTRLAIHAFEVVDELEARFRSFYTAGRAAFEAWIQREPRVQTYPNDGCIFEWIELPGGLTGEQLNELLTREFETHVTPGSFFGVSNHIRLTTALPADDLTEALNRISKALDRLL